MSSETLTLVTALPIPIVIAIALAMWLGVRRAAHELRMPAARRTSLLIKTGALLGAWLLLAFWLGASGVLRGSSTEALPMAALAMVLTIVVGLSIVATSQTARDILAATPPHLLIGVQVYRSIGAIFLVLFALGRAPGAFALPAGWGDVLIGVSAPIVAWLYRSDAARWRGLAILWNVIGIADLVIAVSTGVLTSPGRLQRLAFDLPNVLITSFPLVLIPAVLVPASILLHLFSLRSLRAEPRRRLVAA
jgi:hypothetical protein